MFRPRKDRDKGRKGRKRGEKWMRIEKNFRDVGNSGRRKRMLNPAKEVTCEMTGKVPFPTQQSCALANRDFRGSVYICQYCNCWHFSKQIKKP